MHVEHGVGLFHVFGPVGQAVSTWSSGVHGYEVILPCLDCAFGCVGAMAIWWGVLEFCEVWLSSLCNWDW